jgi:hypothetical protein
MEDRKIGAAMIKKHRDISIIEIGGELLTVACDSCGGVGLLKGDIVKTDGFNVGYHTAFVALAETLAIGAEPIMVIDTLSVSLDDYGKSILNGIKSAASEAAMESNKAVTGSSEENFKSLSTGLGVTVLGKLTGNDYLPIPADYIYDAVLIGFPCSGEEVLKNKAKILTLNIIRTLKKDNSVIDIIPAGSRGVLFESNQLAESLGLKFIENAKNPDLIRKSAGPATCAVAVVKSGTYKQLNELTDIPIMHIGEFLKSL